MIEFFRNLIESLNKIFSKIFGKSKETTESSPSIIMTPQATTLGKDVTSETMSWKGVDISEHNGNVDFNALKNAGIEFVIIRCGFGSDYTHQDDSYFETNVQKAEAAGMPWGTYLYSYATNASMAKSEAEHVRRLLNGRVPRYGVWYDVEDPQIANADLTTTCKTFCQEMEKDNLYAGIYASLSWMESKLTKLGDYDKWVAQWNDECTYDGAYGLWQFTNSLSIGGKAFDGNYAYYDYPATIDKMQGVDEPDEPEEKPEDKPTEVPEEKPEKPEKPDIDDSDIDEDIVNDGEVTNPPENDDNVNDGEAGDGEDEGWSVDDGNVPDEEEPEPPIHEHKWSTEWSSDGECHWHECLNPDCPITKNNEKDGYGAHKYDDEHDATCNVCGHVREVEPEHEHKWDTAWSHDGQHHWHECLNPDCDITDNAKKAGYDDHVFSDDQDTTCNVCGYVREVEPPKHEHDWSTEWSSDGTYHWHECLNPGCDITDNKDKDGYGKHEYSDDQDTTCNICGYVREVEPPKHEHDWSDKWTFNETHHWHKCEAAGCDITDDADKDGYAPHVFDDDQDTTCNVCGYVREVEPPKHEHEWSRDWTFSESHHWHECLNDGCDITLDKDKKSYGPHVYDNEYDDTCNVCGYKRSATPEPEPEPGEHMTEEEATKLVVKQLNTYFDNLAKLPASEWAEPMLEAVIKAGIMSGDTEDLKSMRPQDFITREEMATVVTNGLHLNAKVSSWAKASWDKAADCGLLNGERPGDFITREEFAIVLDRLGLV